MWKKVQLHSQLRQMQSKTDLRNYFQILDCQESKSLTTHLLIHTHILLMEIQSL